MSINNRKLPITDRPVLVCLQNIGSVWVNYGSFEIIDISLATEECVCRTSLVRTPGDRQNMYCLSGIRINQYHLY